MADLNYDLTCIKEAGHNENHQHENRMMTGVFSYSLGQVLTHRWKKYFDGFRWKTIYSDISKETIVYYVTLAKKRR
ncbi:hypothetical protein [Lentibacillus juripiscarius]|uniref:hypothetical protein n=1 Tax=Lentibacillus juripiscarius TaxID=257446 RepID=UPI0036D21A6E